MTDGLLRHQRSDIRPTSSFRESGGCGGGLQRTFPALRWQRRPLPLSSRPANSGDLCEFCEGEGLPQGLVEAAAKLPRKCPRPVMSEQQPQEGPPPLGPEQLAVATSLLLVGVIASWYLELNLAGKIVIAALRATVQLAVLGYCLLVPLFRMASPSALLAYLTFM
eukprot:scaffold2048_cov224-Pinguiococcus_pyrenoidosus.AAC.11